MRERTAPGWIWTLVDKNGPIAPALGTRCWVWKGETVRHGYGRVTIDHHRTFAHRHAYAVASGAAIPEGDEVCHRCDNPPCCNPDHLFLGTQTDNHRDMVSKGRHAIGARDGQAKLTNAQAAEIRRLDGTMLQRDIGARFGVSKQTVSKIVRGDRWRHMPVAAGAAQDRRANRADRK